MPRKLQGVTTRATAQIEHGGALGRVEKGQNLLGFAHGHLTGPQLREEKALQTLPECVVFKPG
jgi:hypothetical protein